ncbi:MAG: ABC transporter permease subunit [Anaerolineae bacterium]|nr:ABC transporter permease subunit [Anaerolineae bacterium]
MRLPRTVYIILNVYALILAGIMIWPVLQMLLTSVTSDVVFPPQNFSLNAFNRVLWPGFFHSMGVSLQLGFWSTLLLISICLPTAYVLERRRFPGRSLLSAVIFVPTIFPSVTYVIAIGVYVAIYFIELRGTFPIIVIATAMGAIPLVVRTIQGSLATSDPVYEEAAVVMGASPMQAFFRVTLPLIAPGVITAATIAFTFSATNFLAPWILGATDPPVAVYIYRDVERLGFTPELAVQVLVMEFIILGMVQGLYFVFRKQLRGVFT